MHQFGFPAGSIIVGFFFLLAIGVGLGGFVFWFWMLVDLLKREFPEERENEKIVWLLVLLALNLIGAVLYFFLGREKEE
jgi:hypothetical protein